jgi:hypothetical protein
MGLRRDAVTTIRGGERPSMRAAAESRGVVGGALTGFQVCMHTTTKGVEQHVMSAGILQRFTSCQKRVPQREGLTMLSVDVLTVAGRLCGRVRRSAR